MRGMRNTSFVVSLVVLASLVGHFAIHRHFERRMQTTATAVESEFSSPAVMGPSVTGQSSFFGNSKSPEILTAKQSPSEGHVVPAIDRQIGSGHRKVIPSGNPDQTAPSPADAANAENSDTDVSPDNSGDENAVRNVIEHELSHATREEREIWYDELKSLPAGVVRDLLQVRKQIRALPRILGGVPEKLASTETSLSNRTQEIAAEPASQKIRFSPSDQSPAAQELEAAISQLRHNLTNSSTPGFKRLRVMLVDAYSTAERETNSYDGSESNEFRVQGDGCRLAPLVLDLKQGSLKKTERQFDLAIDGEGFFIVRKGDKDYLTRCGAFTIDRNRLLCLALTTENTVLQPPVCIPYDVREIQVSADGIVTALKSGDSTMTSIGKLQLARVPSPARLQPAGNSLFATCEQSGDISMGTPMLEGFGEIHQGVLELSNVDFERERDEIEEFATILKSLPLQNTRPATASKLPPSPAH